jgi:hypothetical protein
MQLQLTVIDLIVTVLEKQQSQQVATLEQVLGQVVLVDCFK